MEQSYNEIFVTVKEDEINNNNIEEDNPLFEYFDLKENKPIERILKVQPG